jgi:WD40 repeat protein
MSVCSALSTFAFLWASAGAICSASTPIIPRLPNVTSAIDGFDASVGNVGIAFGSKVPARDGSLKVTPTSPTVAEIQGRAATQPEPELIYSADFNQRFDFISAFNPAYVVSDPASRVIDVRSVETLRVRFRSDILESEPDIAMISDDGSTLLTALDEENVQLWNLDTGERFDMPRIGRLTWAWLSNDGQYVLRLTQDGQMQMWDSRERKPIFQKSVGREQFGMISPDNLRIITQGLAEGVFLWDAQSGELLETLDGQILNQYAFSPDSTRFLTFSVEGQAHVWISQNGAADWALPHIPAKVKHAAFSNDSSRLAVVSEFGNGPIFSNTSIYTLEDGIKEFEINNQLAKVTAMTFRSDASAIFLIDDWARFLYIDTSTGQTRTTIYFSENQLFDRFIGFDKYILRSYDKDRAEMRYYVHSAPEF